MNTHEKIISMLKLHLVYQILSVRACIHLNEQVRYGKHSQDPKMATYVWDREEYVSTILCFRDGR